MTIEYNEKNLKMVSKAIYNNLSEDMLPKKWVERNKSNPMFGHCHTASGCLQKIFGTKTLKLNRALDDENIYHWWCVDTDGKIIDLTSQQYTKFNRTPPYENGTKSGMLGFDYRKRVLSLLDKVTYDLGFQKGW
tara:strand:- start:280 stop:681 length:402 start_codon:yes stop_codon:yes gene_type:complete